MFGDRLRQIRENKGISQAELARKADISRSLYNKYERTNTQPSTDILLALAKELDTSIDYLLGNTDDPTPPNKDKFDNKALIYQRKKSRTNAELISTAIGIPLETYQAYEKGLKQPPLEVVEWLAKYFDCTVDYLMGRSDLPEGKVHPIVDISTEGQKKEASASISDAEALRIYCEGKMGRQLTQEELSRIDDFMEIYIKGLNK